MKQRHVPLDKLSKRKQREYHAARRKDWGGFCPVTRMPPNPKAYNRKKTGRQYEHGLSPGFYIFACIAEVGAVCGVEARAPGE